MICANPCFRLYRSLGDYDVLRGIFTSQIGTQEITQQALEAEARGDYAQALKLYNEVFFRLDYPGMIFFFFRHLLLNCFYASSQSLSRFSSTIHLS